MSAPLPPSNASDLANLVEQTRIPTSFNGSELLYLWNLFLMTAFTCLGVMAVGWLVGSLFKHRKYDALRHPVTIYRAGWAFAAAALTLRAGAEAAALWGWDPKAASTAATLLNLKRWVDPVSVTFGGAWLVLLVLSYNSMVSQLRKAPFPVPMLARLPSLKRPAAVVALCFAAAVGVALSR